MTAALRVLAYGVSTDAVDEYVRIANSTARQTLRHFVNGMVECFADTYLRKPTPDDLEKILQSNAQRGFPGMLGSLDCTHWEWKNCPTGWAGQFTGKEGSPTVILEAVATADLWIWHAFFGAAGSNNDLNVLNRSTILDDYAAGTETPVVYHLNGKTYTRGTGTAQ